MLSSILSFCCYNWMFTASVILSLWCFGLIFFQRSVNLSFANKVILITGGGSGIGRKMAVKFAAMNAHVIIWDIFEQGMAETCALIANAGGKCSVYRVDITNEELVNQSVQSILNEFGAIDILVNNAGVVFGRRILDAPSSHIRRTIDVNLLANFWTVRAVLPSMLARARAARSTTSSEIISFVFGWPRWLCPWSSAKPASGGHIVTVSSVCAFSAFHSLGDYCASKWGSFAFAETLRNEIDDEIPGGVDTTIVCPYFIDTGMFHGLKPSFFARLLSGPALNEDRVAGQIVQAVFERSPVVVLPSHLVLMHLMHLLPTWLADALKQMVGVSVLMKSFQGRGAEFNLHGRPATANLN